MDSIIPPKEDASTVTPPNIVDDLHRSFEKIALGRLESTDSSKEADEWVQDSLTRLQFRVEKRKQTDDNASFSPVWTNDTVLEMYKLYKFLNETGEARGDDEWSEEENRNQQQLVSAAVDRMQLDYLHRHIFNLQVYLCTVEDKDIGSYCARTIKETEELLQFYVDILVCLDISKDRDGFYDLDAHDYSRESAASIKFLSQLCKKATNALRLFLWNILHARGNNFWTREDKGNLKGLFLEVLDLGRVIDVPVNEEDLTETSVDESSEEERGRPEKRGRRVIRGQRKERGRRKQRPEKVKEKEEYGNEKKYGKEEDYDRAKEYGGEGWHGEGERVCRA